jgi:hypothetical protein
MEGTGARVELEAAVGEALGAALGDAEAAAGVSVGVASGVGVTSGVGSGVGVSASVGAGLGVTKTTMGVGLALEQPATATSSARATAPRRAELTNGWLMLGLRVSLSWAGPRRTGPAQCYATSAGTPRSEMRWPLLQDLATFMRAAQMLTKTACVTPVPTAW